MQTAYVGSLVTILILHEKLMKRSQERGGASLPKRVGRQYISQSDHFLKFTSRDPFINLHT